MTETRHVTNYGLVGPTTGGQIKWLQTPEAVAEAFLLGTYPNAKLRLLVDGEVTHGLPDEVDVVYDALDRLLDEAD